MSGDLDVADFVSLFRAAIWVVLAFLQWRIARRLYPTHQAVLTINAIVFLALGVGAFSRAVLDPALYEAWVMAVLAPLMTGAAVVSFGVWLSRKR